MLFKRIKETVKQPSLSKQEARTIYEYLKDGLNATEVFVQHGHKIRHTNQVKAEAKRLETELIAYMLDSPGTEAQLRASLASDLLDIPTLVVDVRSWADGVPENRPTYSAYKNSFIKNG